MENMVHKVTLSSKKVVLLRDFKIKHQRLAAQAASPKAGEDVNVLGLLMGEELIKILVCEIDGKTPSPSDMEDLDNVFTYAEFNEVSSVIKQLTGDITSTPKMELVPYGGQ